MTPREFFAVSCTLLLCSLAALLRSGILMRRARKVLTVALKVDRVVRRTALRARLDLERAKRYARGRVVVVKRQRPTVSGLIPPR